MFLPLAFCYMSEVEMEVRKMGLAPNRTLSPKHSHGPLKSRTPNLICISLIQSLLHNNASDLYFLGVDRMQVLDYTHLIESAGESVEAHVGLLDHGLGVRCVTLFPYLTA